MGSDEDSATSSKQKIVYAHIVNVLTTKAALICANQKISGCSIARKGVKKGNNTDIMVVSETRVSQRIHTGKDVDNWVLNRSFKNVKFLIHGR